MVEVDLYNVCTTLAVLMFVFCCPYKVFNILDSFLFLFVLLLVMDMDFEIITLLFAVALLLYTLLHTYCQRYS